MPDLTSRPYRPDDKQCCEACVFGGELHEEWCPQFIRPALARGSAAYAKWLFNFKYRRLGDAIRRGELPSLQIHPEATN